MKVCCVFLLESPHRGDSNEYTQYTVFNVKKKITQNYPKSAAMGFCSKGLKNEFETAVVNEPTVFEALKFYCINSLGNDHFKVAFYKGTQLLCLSVLLHLTTTPYPRGIFLYTKVPRKCLHRKK